jgi:hypothetical protein
MDSGSRSPVFCGVEGLTGGNLFGTGRSVELCCAWQMGAQTHSDKIAIANLVLSAIRYERRSRIPLQVGYGG